MVKFLLSATADTVAITVHCMFAQVEGKEERSHENQGPGTNGRGSLVQINV